MKLSFMTILLALASFTTAPSFGASLQEGLPLRNVYSTTNINSTAYVQLVASTVKGVAAISVFNSGTAPVEIALGASGSEVPQLIAAPVAGTSGVPVVYPLSAGYGSRVSVISVGSNNSTGELEVNLIYN